MLTSTPKTNKPASEQEEIDLALAMSISTEMIRRESPGFLSTQEYREDEARRASLLNESEEDMFATSGAEDSVTNVRHEGGEEEEQLEMTEEEEFDEHDVRNQPFPCFSQFRQGQGDSDNEDVMTKSRWCGEKKLKMKETKSGHVGQPVRPTVVVQLSNETVAENSLRLVKNTKDEDPVLLKACQDAKIKLGILKTTNLSDKAPFNLQYLGFKTEGDQVVLKLSDGKNKKNFVVSEKFAFMFKENKMIVNSIITILKIRAGPCGWILKNFKVAPMGKKVAKIGNPQ